MQFQTDQKSTTSSTGEFMARTIRFGGILPDLECPVLNEAELHQHAMGGGKVSATVFYLLIVTLMKHLNYTGCLKRFTEEITRMMQKTVIRLIQNGNVLSDLILAEVVSFKSNEPITPAPILNYLTILTELLVLNGCNLNQTSLTHALTCDFVSDEPIFNAFKELTQFNPSVLKKILHHRPSLVPAISNSEINKPMFLTITCNFGSDENVLYLVSNGYNISEELFATLLDKQRNKTLNYLVLKCVTRRYSKYPKNFPCRSFLMMCVNMLY
jgi:hypothetical protein